MGLGGEKEVKMCAMKGSREGGRERGREGRDWREGATEGGREEGSREILRVLTDKQSPPTHSECTTACICGNFKVNVHIH